MLARDGHNPGKDEPQCEHGSDRPVAFSSTPVARWPSKNVVCQYVKRGISAPQLFSTHDAPTFVHYRSIMARVSLSYDIA